MMAEGARYFRFVMFADPALGEASLSWRFKCCLEAAGHTVLWFEPCLQPYAFARAGALRAYMVRSLLRVQRPDVVILADGLVPDYPDDLIESANCPVGALVEGRDAASALARGAVEGVFAPDFAVTCGIGAHETLLAGGFAGCAYGLRPLPDEELVTCGLANTVAKKPGILCLQDATPERIAAIRAIKGEPESAASPVRCYGSGWPKSWTADPSGTSAVYALRRAHVAVVFGDGTDGVREHALGVALAAGARGLSLGGAHAGGAWAEKLEECEDVERFARLAAESVAAFESREAPDRLGLLDDDVAAFVRALREDFAPRGHMEGSPNPRAIVCVYGFIGRGNFANEHILSTIDARVRRRLPGSTVVAVSMDPRHTFEHRGVYAISSGDKRLLDKAVERSCAVLVIAGLLVDQGVRWGMGKAEMLSNMAGCDVYALSALATLCSLNDTKMVFYGVGAGPLELDDSRRMVRLMGTLGASFIARDEESAALFAGCDVPESRIEVKADPAFLGSYGQTDAVDEWLAHHGIDVREHRILAVTLRSGEGIAPDFPRRVAAAIDAAVAADARLRPVFCVMDTPDVDVIEALRLYLDKVDELCVLRAGERHEMLGDLFARAYTGFSMQYYSTLAMARAGVPCVGVSHQVKEAALFSQVGCEELSLTVEASAEEMTGRLLALLDGRDEWAARVAAGARHLVARAEEAEDMVIEEVLARVPAKSHAIAGEFYLQVRSVSDRERDKVEEKLAAEASALSAECDKVRRDRAGRAYKLGQALTFIPRKLGL